MKLFQLDAFCEGPFTGNPAAVVPLSSWPADDWMQNVAMENQLSETAFLVPEGEGFRIRWFTPGLEVDLCGHATLASAAVIWEKMGWGGESLTFQSRSGPLHVFRERDLYILNFPSDDIRQVDHNPELVKAIGKEPLEEWEGTSDSMLVFRNEDEVLAIRPDFEALKVCSDRGVIVTAPGDSVDFVSRFFCPNAGINEDPVTGSAHTSLTPYWNQKTGKKNMIARQLSSRGGKLFCEYLQERTQIAGNVNFFLEGKIL